MEIRKIKRADPQKLRQEDSDAVWNELAYFKRENQELMIQKWVSFFNNVYLDKHLREILCVWKAMREIPYKTWKMKLSGLPVKVRKKD